MPLQSYTIVPKYAQSYIITVVVNSICCLHIEILKCMVLMLSYGVARVCYQSTISYFILVAIAETLDI
jgi:hypothetical protein